MNDTFAVLMRLGGRYERAEQAGDFERMDELDNQLASIGRPMSGWREGNWLYLDCIRIPILRGRNHIRRLRGQREDWRW